MDWLDPIWAPKSDADGVLGLSFNLFEPTITSETVGTEGALSLICCWFFCLIFYL